jgi:trigger factor
MNLKNVEKKEKNTAVLTVEVGAEEFDAAVEKVYRKNKGVIALPGFRKGKAPRKLVEQMYGADVFFEDAVNDLYPEALTAAVKESGLDMVGYPSVEMQSLSKDGFTFTATIALRPVPVLGTYKGIEAPKAEVTVTAEDVDGELKPLISRATHQVVVERPAQNGDIVVIDFEGFKDGVAFEGGKAEQYPLELGSGSFIPGFEDQLVGLSAGEEKDVNVTFPEDYGATDLAGAPVVFKVKVHEVKESQVPTLDDEFAKDVSEFETLDELKADLEKKLRERREESAQRDFENAVLTKLIENTEMEVPDAMVEYEADRIIEDYEGRMQGAGFTFDQYLQMMGTTRADFRENAKIAALRQIQGDLIFAAVAEAEQIQPSEEEIAAEYQKLADEYDMEVDTIKKAVPEEEIVRQLRTTQASKLVYDAAVATAPVAEEAPAAEETAE